MQLAATMKDGGKHRRLTQFPIADVRGLTEELPVSVCRQISTPLYVRYHTLNLFRPTLYNPYYVKQKCFRLYRKAAGGETRPAAHAF